MLEKDVEKKIGDYAKSLGCLYYKFKAPGNRAVPDRLIISPVGEVLFLELKAPGKEPTKLQLREIQKIRDQGSWAEWTDNIKQGKAFIDLLCVN